MQLWGLDETPSAGQGTPLLLHMLELTSLGLEAPQWLLGVHCRVSLALHTSLPGSLSSRERTLPL